MDKNRLRQLAGMPAEKTSSNVLFENSGNKYYEVTEPLTVWVAAGYIPTNNYYGASRIYRQTWKKTTLNPGDEIHWLHGGLFAVTVDGSGKEEKREGRHAKLSEPTESSNFAYSGITYDPRKQQIKELINAGKIEYFGNTPDGYTKYIQPS